MHPLTPRLAAAMYEADGRPRTDARGDVITIDRYRSWADSALWALVAITEDIPTGHATEASVPGMLEDLATYFGQPTATGQSDLESRLHRAT